MLIFIFYKTSYIVLFNFNKYLKGYKKSKPHNFYTGGGDLKKNEIP